MRISVVVCTLNRAPELRQLLAALRLQDHRDFEVIVVAGPSEDETDEVLAEAGDTIRVVRNPAAHLSRSRNLGIDAAAGELVAFTDDDAIPEPRWLARLHEELERDAGIAAVGGFVRLRDGVGWQQRYVVCTRTGEAVQLDEPPTPKMALPGADPFVFAMGGNGCYRRSALEQVGGFDEVIEYYLDETDLGARMVDAGLPARQVDGAAIIHRTRASRMRDASGRLTDAYAVVKNHTYFARMNGSSHADESIESWAEFWRGQARDALRDGAFDEQACAAAIARVDAGVADGEAAAARGERGTRAIAPPEPDAFRLYPTLEREPGARRAAFVSSGYPPASYGGIGRYSQDLATGLAARGWELHVIVADIGQTPSLELEDGVWVHRVAATPAAGALPDDAVTNALARAAGARAGLLAVEERFGPLEVVSAPLWSGEALLCELDGRWPTVTTLMTSMHTVAGMYPEWPPALTVRLLELEAETLRHARHLHAISQAVLDDVRAVYPREAGDTPADVVHLGVPDRRGSTLPDDDAGAVRMLFVGRLERRKGIDTLLEAVPEVLARHPRAELLVVGRDVDGVGAGAPYAEAFAAAHPGLVARVRFAGEVDEAALRDAYREADMFVAPSRYESFGLVHAEALMMGLPVVACASGGVVELVEDGVSGLLVAPGDGPALARALESLVANGDRRAAMGAAARRRYEERFSVSRAVAATAAAYGRVAGGHTRAEPPAEIVERRLAESLERVLARPAPEARRLAAAMLAGGAGDPLAALQTLWTVSDADFVDGVYRAVLSRDPEPPVRLHLIGMLASGQHRCELVREVGWSREGRARPQGTAWLGDLLNFGAWRDEDACWSAFSRVPDERFAQDVVDLLVRDAAARDAGRALIGEQLAGGASRLAAALALAHSGLPLRPAPDFDGWEPLLTSIAGAVAGATATSAAPPAASPTLLRRLRGRAGVLKRLSGDVRVTLERVRATDKRSLAMAEALGRVEEQLRERERARADERVSLAGERAETETALRAQLRELQQDGAAGRDALRGGVDSVAARGAEAIQMTELLMRKVDAVAVDLRDRLPPSLSTPGLPEPRILSPLPDDAVKVNLGAGEKPLDGYVNVDARELPGIAVIADARRLPFAPGSLAELMSAHLVEHFRQNQLEVAVLPYWRSLLRPDGVLRVICPNWEEMTHRLADGRLSWDEYKLLTFGLQDYDGDDHFAMYTPASLEATLRTAGFTDVKLVVAARQNGICPEMELTARPT